jgi:hypothetical protein
MDISRIITVDEYRAKRDRALLVRAYFLADKLMPEKPAERDLRLIHPNSEHFVSLVYSPLAEFVAETERQNTRRCDLALVLGSHIRSTDP